MSGSAAHDRPEVRKALNEAAREEIGELLQAHELTHLGVLTRGRHVVIYSEEMDKKVPRVRFARIGYEKYELDIANHRGSVGADPFRGYSRRALCDREPAVRLGPDRLLEPPSLNSSSGATASGNELVGCSTSMQNPRCENAVQRRLYLISTPYHALLAWTLASCSSSRHSSHLVAIANAEHLRTLVEVMSAVPETPFATRQILPGMFRKDARVKPFIAAANVVSVRRIVRRVRPQEVYVFNDSRPEAQAALYSARELVAARGVYVEDGMAAYLHDQAGLRTKGTMLSQQGSRLRKTVTRRIRRVLYGPWWQRLTTFGTSKWIDEIRALFPEHLRPELAKKPIRAIPPDCLLNDAGRAMVQQYCTRVLEAGRRHALASDVLLILPHSTVLDRVKDYGIMVNSALSTCVANGLSCAVKYHPRDEAKNPLGVPQRMLVPRELPAEAIYMLNDNLKIVIGERSTALMSARWMRPRVAVVSILPDGNFGNGSARRKLQALGITCLTDASGLQHVIDAIVSHF